ncbi:MAG: phosphatase PAP2 family protein [Verrucomicrobia bacterium]|nr:phosphatase PAP2 family protein [Verrucomicrobiota bacterium]
MNPLDAWLGVFTIVLACLIPVCIYIIIKVRTGHWSDYDVSQRRDRPHLFGFGLIMLLSTCLVLQLSHQSPVFIRGCMAAISLVLAASLLNLWLKLSMHAGFAMLTSCSLWSFETRVALVAMLFAVLVGWSRVTLARHTWQEVIAGLALGVVVARIFFA